MQYRLSSVPADDGHEEVEDLNRFLRAHRVVSVEKVFRDSAAPRWYFVVEYLEGAAGDGQGRRRSRRVDYKEQLKQWYREIEGYLLDRLALALNPLRLNRTAQGMTFLGYRVFPEAIRLSRRSRKRFVRKFTAYERKWQDGFWSDRELAEHVTPLLAFVKQADTFGFRKKIMDEYGVYPQARTA